ncbi:Probable RNA-directed DNA polymerase from transposon BS [Eumeta japonica]|uniref:Probable RNA-directed DNA polymerase from transposon BS n=1 Tax=Eumeta variegata TaxID=151549 RepID=A0A4C1V1C2_EUMVA|nr:Probable RNA-directed DNA polymerase from transposon BS [Eumeta japonica]
MTVMMVAIVAIVSQRHKIINLCSVKARLPRMLVRIRILNQLLQYFYNNNLMNVKQFGFTKGRSTTEVGVELIQQIFGAWEDSWDAIGVFCDLSKAFDCIHHDTLIRKLHHYDVTGRSLELLEFYPSERIQRVDINGERSSESAVNMGVPQGSVLEPFLFLVYINDLPHLVKNSHGDCIVC